MRTFSCLRNHELIYSGVVSRVVDVQLSTSCMYVTEAIIILLLSNETHPRWRGCPTIGITPRDSIAYERLNLIA